MSTLDVNAALQVEEGGALRRLRVDDMAALPAGASTEATLQLAAARLLAVVDALAVVASEPTLAQLRDRLPAALADGALAVTDAYDTLEALPSQAGADGVLAFTFAAPRRLIWARSIGGLSYARVGADPAAGVGVPLADDEPHPLTVTTVELRVWAPAGATVFAWGYA